MIVAGFAHCKLGVGAAAVVEPDEAIKMQELFDAVVKGLEELSVVDSCENVLDDDQDAVDRSADIANQRSFARVQSDAFEPKFKESLSRFAHYQAVSAIYQMGKGHNASVLPHAPSYSGCADAPLRDHAHDAGQVSKADAVAHTPSSPPSALSPASVSASFVEEEEMDAISLLIKSEELLSILDASTVFSATGMGAGMVSPTAAPDIGGGVPALKWVAAHSSPKKAIKASPEYPRPSQLISTAAVAAPYSTENKKTRKRPKGSRSDQLDQQREAVLKLEVELILLRQQQQSSALARTKRSQIWKELSARQLGWRQLAESENQQLKAMMREFLAFKDPWHFEKYLGTSGELRLPNHYNGPWKGAALLSRNAVYSTIFESLLQSLDARFAEVDAVFRENGMDKSLTESRMFAQKKSRRLSQPGRYLELVNMEMSPFPWLSIGNTVWECNKEWHFKDAPYAHPCSDRPEDTFAVSYRVESKTVGQQHSANFKMAMRRYVEANRVVLVYASQSDGEDDLAGVSTTEVGYFAASSTNLLSEPNSPPVSVVQICMHISPRSTGEGDSDDDAGDAKVESLLKLMMGAFQDDVSHIHQRTDSLLLQSDARNNGTSRGAARETMQSLDARITFKHLDR